MPGLAGYMASLFEMPGRPPAGADRLKDQTAATHETLLIHARGAREDDCGPPFHRLLSLLPQVHRTKCRILCHPVLVEGLHALASSCPALREWHRRVAAPDPAENPPDDGACCGPVLGAVLLPLLLRADRGWRGVLRLSTDGFGQLRFPLCDWSLHLCVVETGGRALLAGQPVTLRLDAHRALWSLGDAGDQPFLIMPREACVRMIAGNDRRLERVAMTAPDRRVQPRWQCASYVCNAATRYVPVCFPDVGAHAGLCGGLARRLHDAVRRNSPAIHREFYTYIESIHGFELPRSASGVIQSFSDPTRPGVMGLNLTFTAEGEPQACPFCFTWLGHEMAHTKLYLICGVAWHQGWAFLDNPEESTGWIPRYGRALTLRTLFQIPYTHLYEWVLLMDFLDVRFRGVPWPIETSAADFGRELREEIVEAFDRLNQRARLTPAGRAAVNHFRQLFHEADARWRMTA